MKKLCKPIFKNKESGNGGGIPTLKAIWELFDLTRLTDGGTIALDDTKIENPYGKKLPFLCWLFDSSDKHHV